MIQLKMHPTKTFPTNTLLIQILTIGKTSTTEKWKICPALKAKKKGFSISREQTVSWGKDTTASNTDGMILFLFFLFNILSWCCIV